MIDFLRLSLPLNDDVLNVHKDGVRTINYKKLASFGIRLVGDCELVNGTWETTELKHPFESIPSSHSGMAFKIYQGNEKTWPHVELKASPAKLAQGHNVYGSDDFAFALHTMLGLFAVTHPRLYDYVMHDSIELRQIDVTYSAQLRNQMEVSAVLEHLYGVGHRHTKANNGSKYNGTVYFGSKNSKYKCLKFYDKYAEVLNDIKTQKRAGKDTSALEEAAEAAKRLLRAEASVRKCAIKNDFGTLEVFKILPILKNDPTRLNQLWSIAWTDIFDALKGDEVTMKDDAKLLEKLLELDITEGRAKAAYRFYLSIKTDGYEFTKQTTSNSTFHRNKGYLMNAGISHARLQSNAKSNVIPMVRICDLNFKEQAPEGYELPSLQEVLAA